MKLNLAPSRGSLESSRDTTLQRFWAGVDKRGPDECWEWKRSLGSAGYGAIGLSHGAGISTHRYSWLIHNGPIRDGLYVCHSCDNKLCVNPAHLWLGTAWDNITDARIKGRTNKFAKTHCPHGHEFTPENTVIERRKGFDYRKCRECNRLRSREQYLRSIR